MRFKPFFLMPLLGLVFFVFFAKFFLFLFLAGGVAWWLTKGRRSHRRSQLYYRESDFVPGYKPEGGKRTYLYSRERDIVVE